ncbi:MAG: diacylglycerol kinase family lipid kinase [Bacteroidetes bacterium]|nr:diacylglycerol kinase family lipid kinase [Bacteroidota bacterium]
MKATLILNPKSGKRRAMTVRDTARSLAQELGIDLTEHVIAAAGDGTRMARAAVEAGHARVISVGGDGTLNAVAAGLVGTPVPLGIVAMGSGNGYARSLGLPMKPEAALRTALTGGPRPMDVCYLNDRLFLGTAGIGFDARVAHEFDRGAGRGMWNYARIILKEILGAKPMRVVVKAGHETREEHVLMMVFCNTREFGNGAVISPGSAPDDGTAELQLVAKPSFLPLLKAFYDVYTHRADRSRYIRTIVARDAQVHQDGLLAHLDGEPVEIGREVRFRLEPKRLLVVG